MNSQNAYRSTINPILKIFQIYILPKVFQHAYVCVVYHDRIPFDAQIYLHLLNEFLMKTEVIIIRYCKMNPQSNPIYIELQRNNFVSNFYFQYISRRLTSACLQFHASGSTIVDRLPQQPLLLLCKVVAIPQTSTLVRPKCVINRWSI